MFGSQRLGAAFLSAVLLSALATPSAARAGVNPVMVQPPVVTALPDLAVSLQAPAYTLGATCSTGGPAIVFHLRVRNDGIGPSSPISAQQAGVMIQTSMINGKAGSVWSVTSSLPAISGHSAVNLDVNLPPPGNGAPPSGAHIFSVAVNPIGVVKELSTTNNSATVAVTIPNGFCANRISLTPTLSHVVVPVQNAGADKMQPGSNATPQPVYSILQLQIVTGSDDLRSDSTLTADIGWPPTYNPIQCDLKTQKDDSWENNSTHTIPCFIPYLTASVVTQIRVELIMSSCNCNFGETWDNWNIAHVLIQAYEPGSNQPLCVFNAGGGDQWIRLKSDLYGGASVNMMSYVSQC